MSRACVEVGDLSTGGSSVGQGYFGKNKKKRVAFAHKPFGSNAPNVRAILRKARGPRVSLSAVIVRLQAVYTKQEKRKALLISSLHFPTLQVRLQGGTDD